MELHYLDENQMPLSLAPIAYWIKVVLVQLLVPSVVQGTRMPDAVEVSRRNQVLHVGTQRKVHSWMVPHMIAGLLPGLDQLTNSVYE